MDRETIEHRRQQLIQLHEQGLAGGAIGRELGISRQRVHQLSVLLGLTKQSLQVRRARVAELISQGSTLRQIAQIVECSPDAVYRDAKALGLLVALRSNRKPMPAYLARLARPRNAKPDRPGMPEPSTTGEMI